MSKIYVDEIAGIASADTVAIPGHVIQVVTDTGTDNVAVSDATFVSLGQSVTITPTSTSSKILIMTDVHMYIQAITGSEWSSSGIRIKRDSTVLKTDAGFGVAHNINGNADRMMLINYMSYYDSPNTTSSITYSVEGARFEGASSVIFNRSSYGHQGQIIVMEIAG